MTTSQTDDDHGIEEWSRHSATGMDPSTEPDGPFRRELTSPDSEPMRGNWEMSREVGVSDVCNSKHKEYKYLRMKTGLTPPPHSSFFLPPASSHSSRWRTPPELLQGLVVPIPLGPNLPQRVLRAVEPFKGSQGLGGLTHLL
ncbi:unnamed protein product [Pleuronectes platessa]|uniref:Uncharacterized protein n=1 Tax=Pleuronectes platessa TaxID=8262 RepID=A0A9N7YT47_PLEPL|nr:unnamed protein product [Pleuronectes platessa]